MDALDLVIFDCDGVLVDSEPLAIGLLAAEARALGWALEPAEAEHHFPRGGTLERCVATIEARIGHPVPADFVTRFRAQLYATLRAQAQPVPGVIELLDALTTPCCVASNGPREKIRTSLTTLGLLARFEGRIFSAYELERSKPFPDLYLHAAATLGAAPTRCVVVEDSVPGAQAGVAAGMRVLGYAPAAQQREALARVGAQPFGAMHELLGLLDG